MSDLSFKTNFIEMPDGEQTMQENYDSPGNMRNVVFVLSDGNEVMRNYAYLIGVDLYKSEHTNFLKVAFTSDTIQIEGYRLNLLRDLFSFGIPQKVFCSLEKYRIIESRYSIEKISLIK